MGGDSHQSESIGYPQFLTYAMDSDGQSFAAGDNNGPSIFSRKETKVPIGRAQLSAPAVSSHRISRHPETRITSFYDGLLAISSQSLGFARIIDVNTRIHPINVEPVANAGPDLTTTSFDGKPVRVFLNGGLSKLLNYGSTLSAVWSWPGGSATGLQTFASIPLR